MTLPELVRDLERRRQEAARVHAKADVADVLAAVLEDLRPLTGGVRAAAMDATGATWRERLWTCPPQTRLGVPDVAEALGRPKSWVYRATAAARGPRRLPARRLDGELVLEAGDVRVWVTRMEERQTSHPPRRRSPTAHPSGGALPSAPVE